MMYPQPPTFNVHLPPNATPTVKVVFATEDPEPISEEEEEVEIDADDLVQISLPAWGQESNRGRGGGRQPFSLLRSNSLNLIQELVWLSLVTPIELLVWVIRVVTKGEKGCRPPPPYGKIRASFLQILSQRTHTMYGLLDHLSTCSKKW